MRTKRTLPPAAHVDHVVPDAPVDDPEITLDQVRRANPVTYVDKNDPPTLIFHGEEDYFVIINQSEMLYDALKKAGATTELVRVVNGGHGYKPTPEGSVVKPSWNERNALELKWFQKYLKHQ